MEPQVLSAIIKDYATVAALIAGGAWAVSRFVHNEILRRRREMASPDGMLTISCVESGADVVVATLNALWRNRGPLMIELCREHSRVRVCRLHIPAEVRALDIDNEAVSERVMEIVPWWSTYVLEPNTESILQEHFTLERGHVYAFRWSICLPPESLPGGRSPEHWFVRRDLIWQAPAKAIPTSAERQPAAIAVPPPQPRLGAAGDSAGNA
jgi:hypothetical protein